ncbi:MAG: TrkA family potassium uptake protein [Pseudoflavonifractor capillosus]|uniref:potassium channel family protein n=1 Tax=Pseudoflavonifractor capillosus TaxID=106588 RepID=UPI0023F864AA|nr:TrkA family potassium uptake protein [Pseudoflavonifractor capillosus]MCI5929669.1 TrkA family potassium uptake protein [Pseudoflavonifractor capillosus]MDY4659815.1 TrkA family potassium uptake protein [Pseudoflavonifractor capillosus]
MKTFVVIGLGRFGTAVATELCELGHEVLAIDASEESVQQVADRVTHAVTGDARDPAVLRALGVRNYDCAIVAVGDDVGNSALITLNLKDIGVKRVICKAQSHVHRKVLEKIGADRVVFPEHEMGVKLAQGLSSSNVLNFIELSDDFGIVELEIPKSWQHRSIRDLDVRAKHHVNIIAVRKGSTGMLDVAPGGDYVLKSKDAVVTLGRNEDINRLHDL